MPPPTSVQQQPRAAGRQPGSGVLLALRRARLHRSPKAVSLLSLWVLGLLAAFLPPPHISEASYSAFEAKLVVAREGDAGRQAAFEAWAAAEARLREARPWLYWLDAEKRAVARGRRAEERDARAAFLTHERRRQALVAEANAELGLWSGAGVLEGRRLFWNSFNAGKLMAKRQVLWDTLFQVLGGSSERSLLGVLLQLLGTVLVNFTAGLVSSVFIFLFRLPAVLRAYKANLVSGSLFFVVGGIGASAVVATVLLLLWAAGAAVVYGASSLAVLALEDEGRPRSRPRPRLRRPHTE